MYVKYVWAEIASSTWEIAREIAISTMDIAFELLSVKREECRYPKRPGSSIADDVVAKTVCVRPHALHVPVRSGCALVRPPSLARACTGHGPQAGTRSGSLEAQGTVLAVVS